MSEYYRVSDKICKSSVIDDINTSISDTEKDISDIHNNISSLSSPRNCFLYGNSIENFENLLVTINQTLVKLNERFSYFDTGLEEIENTSSQQINEIEIPTIHNAELHNVEFSIPSVTVSPTTSNPVINTPVASQPSPSFSNTLESTNNGMNYENQEQVVENNSSTSVMNENIQENNEEVTLSNEEELINDDSIQFSDEASNDDSYDIEFKDEVELSFPETEVKDNTTEVNSSVDTQSEKEESGGGFNAALVGGIAAAVGAVGAGAAYAFSNMKKDEEKDSDSKRGE